jgi:hypothetical protein
LKTWFQQEKEDLKRNFFFDFWSQDTWHTENLHLKGNHVWSD